MSIPAGIMILMMIQLLASHQRACGGFAEMLQNDLVFKNMEYSKVTSLPPSLEMGLRSLQNKYPYVVIIKSIKCDLRTHQYILQ